MDADSEIDCFGKHRFLGRLGLSGGQGRCSQVVVYGRVGDRFWYGDNGLMEGGERKQLPFVNMRQTLMAALDRLGYQMIVFYGLSEGLIFATPEMRARRDALVSRSEAAVPADDDYGSPPPTSSTRIRNRQAVTIHLEELLQMLTAQHDLRTAVILERAQNLIPPAGDPTSREVTDLLQRMGAVRPGNLCLMVCDVSDIRALPETIFGDHRCGVRRVSVGLPNQEEIRRLFGYVRGADPPLEIPPSQERELIQRIGHLDCVAILDLFARARHLGLPFNLRTLWQLEGHDTGGWNDVLTDTAINRIEHALQRLQGQDHIVEYVHDRLYFVREKLRQRQESTRSDERPLTVFFFAGPTGVGKTEVFRILTSELTGVRHLKINMGEYQQEHQMLRFVGAPPSYRGHPKGELGQFLLDNPASIILFDEFEKAHARIWDCFLSMLEGGLTTGDGERVDMSQTILFFTSNAAAEELQRQTEKMNAADRSTVEKANKKLIVNALRGKQGARPELIGRLKHALLAFNNLDPSSVAAILGPELDKVASALTSWLSNRAAGQLSLDPSVMKYFAKKWGQPDSKEYGAREVVNEVQEVLYDRALALLRREVERRPATDRSVWVLAMSDSGNPLIQQG